MTSLQSLVVSLVPGGHPQACSFPSLCHHLPYLTDGEADTGTASRLALGQGKSARSYLASLPLVS